MICPVWLDKQGHGYLCSEIREHCLYWGPIGIGIAIGCQYTQYNPELLEG